MEAPEIIGACLLGFAGGFAGGLMGVGGGVIFVPALVLLLHQSQLHAEATSLLAVVAVGLAGAWRQHGYGNVRVKDGLLLGVLSPVGAGIGVVAANSLPERALELSFAAVMLYFAWRLGKRALPHV
jgi:uncharacterized membrane protein YfcA